MSDAAFISTALMAALAWLAGSLWANHWGFAVLGATLLTVTTWRASTLDA